MVKEVSHMYEQSGMADALDVMTSLRNSTIRPAERSKTHPIKNYYADIPNETIATIRQIYTYDILQLGYPDGPFEM